jgi:hypothetical protein
LISNVEEADGSYALARSVSVLDAVNWIGLAETVKKCCAKAGFEESDGADNLEAASEIWRVRRRKRKEEKQQLENMTFQPKFVHVNRPFIASVK